MGEIVAFQQRVRSARGVAGPASAGGAQILFFLGVRYARVEDGSLPPGENAPESGNGPRGGGKRRNRARA